MTSYEQSEDPYLCCGTGFTCDKTTCQVSTSGITAWPPVQDLRQDLLVSAHSTPMQLGRTLKLYLPDPLSIAGAEMLFFLWRRVGDHRCLQRLDDANDIVCLQETHGRIEFLRALCAIQTRWHIVGTFFVSLHFAGSVLEHVGHTHGS